MAENETAEVVEETTETETAVETAPVETKPEVPAEVKRALQKANKEAETLRFRLKEFEDRDKTDAQKLQEERDALRAERDDLQSKSLRREVADEKGIDPKHIKYLTGSTREELELSADELSQDFKPSRPTFGDIGQGPRGEGSARVYTSAELNDHAFYLANKADINLALKEGRLIE